MGSCGDIEPRLSEFVDGLLTSKVESDVRAHLRECATCRGVVADLERLRTTARSLGPMAPPSRAWARLEDEIRRDREMTVAPATGSLQRAVLWQWLGLAAALLLVTTAVYLLRGSNAAEAPGVVANGSASEGVADELGRATVPYEDAIRQLEAMTADSDESSMSPGVVAAVRTNLGAIDTAIADSRAALAANPGSESARDSLFEALRRKIALLQTTVSLINDMGAGNQEGAAQAAEKLGKES